MRIKEEQASATFDPTRNFAEFKLGVRPKGTTIELLSCSVEPERELTRGFIEGGKSEIYVTELGYFQPRGTSVTLGTDEDVDLGYSGPARLAAPPFARGTVHFRWRESTSN